MRTAIFALGFALAACGSDPPNVSGTCTMDTNCDEDLTCDTSIPGGYCTQACTTPGSTDGCPEDSICDSVSGAAMSCVRICSTKSDCRADLDCNGITGSNIKACKPKP